LAVDPSTWARLRKQAETDLTRFAPKPRAAVARNQ
jgi:hypothetical protein